MTFLRRRSVPLVATALLAASAGCGPAAGPSASTATEPTIAASAPAPSAAATPDPTPTPIVVRSGDPWLALQQFPGQSTVFLIRPDGTDLHTPTRDVPGGDQTNPDWSPDGEQLVLALNDGNDDLWVVGANGGVARRLAGCEAPCVNLDDPAWSPDGTSVLYSRMTEVDGQPVSTLERVDVASGAIEVLVTASPTFFYAGQRWSPDGGSVVLEVVRLSGPGMDAEVSGVTLAIIDLSHPTPAGRAIVDPARWPETAAWAPDGSEIVLGARPDPAAPGLDIFAVRPDGTGLRRLTTLVDTGGNATHPDVSPDGTRVAFSANLPGTEGSVLGSVVVAGGDVVPATGGSTYVEGVHPRYRPVP